MCLAPTLQCHGDDSSRWSGMTAFPRWSVGTRTKLFILAPTLRRGSKSRRSSVMNLKTIQ